MQPSTPYYVFDIDSLRQRCARIRELAHKSGVGLCYAIKANGFLTPYMLDFVNHLEVCSHGELKLCKKQGVPMDKIILSGVNKEEAFVEDGILSGVDVITAESITHFNYIKKYAKLHNKAVKVLLRLSNGAQFGMEESILEELIKTYGAPPAKKAEDSPTEEPCPLITIEGIHYFTGTQKRKASRIIKELELLWELCDKLEERYGYTPALIEYGPGLGVPYFEGDDFSADMDPYTEVLDWLKENKPGQQISRINFEMGRFFTASCGSYVTGVADIKKADDLNICIIDGGKNHLSYYGQNMALKTPVIKKEALVVKKESDVSEKEPSPVKNQTTDIKEKTTVIERDLSQNHAPGTEKPYTIFGSLCSFNDIIARDVPLRELAIGDKLVFENVGAYSVTEGISLFLSRALPGVYAKENGSLKCLRENKETYDMNG